MRYVLCLCLIFCGGALALAQEEVTHTVRRGDSLYRIALRYGVTVDELMQANDVSDVRQLEIGTTLVIPGIEPPNSGDDVDNPLVATVPVTHIVQRGETMRRIANRYGVTVDAIMRANGIANPDYLRVGESLQIWTLDLSVNPDELTPELTAIDPTPTPQPTAVPSVTHIVQRGEHLAAIAARYGVAWTRIAEANDITNPNTIYAGMTLTIPGVFTVLAEQSVPPIEAVNALSVNLDAPDPRWGIGRELLVDLSSQMAYAYQDGVLQHSALVSTGLPATPTVQGEYAIYHKTPAQTMSGPGYRLPNVQWVMYFYQGYGFHGTYWHDNFGQAMSRGCVNMTNADALWFYNFASIGTNVYVQW